MRARRLATCTALFAITGAVAPQLPAAGATTISVDCDHVPLQPKLQNAAPGSTILIKGTCIGAFGISKNLTLKGDPTATLDADNAGTTLLINGARQVHLRSLVITGGFGPFGAGISAQDGGALTLDQVTVRGNTAEGLNGAAGGGVLMSKGVLTVRDSTISDNSAISRSGAPLAAQGGGLAVLLGSLTIEKSVIASNVARAGNESTVGNASGGGVFAANSGVTITGTAFKLNRSLAPTQQGATAKGGALFWQISTANDLLVTDSTFAKNFATATSVDDAAIAEGGAVDVLMTHSGSAQVAGSTFEGNHAKADAQTGPAFLFGAAINAHANAAPIGIASTDVLDTAGVANGATSATAQGGAVNIGSTGTTLSASTIADTLLTATSTGGNAIAEGGGVRTTGPLTVSRSTIDHNQAQSASDGSAAFGGGGGIQTISQGNLVLRSSTVSDNHASAISQPASAEALGGGIDLEADTADVILNSTITLNSADSSGGNGPDSAGGGIEVVDGTLDLHLVTIVRNQVTASGTNAFAGGGGMQVQQGSPHSEGMILALNTATTGPNCQGSGVSDGFNLFGDLTGCGFLFVGSDQTGVTAPKLGGLAGHGGPTQTVALLAGSPALDRIETATCHAMATKDQRGTDRPQGSKCDEGAFERTV
ncbi:MAG TPA: choice-of-anchor Q domain-containing protein [Actinomycetota bacterium]|nr:choice-of-anchor Q domain-containing protein [Actinomycetota bacterium]